MKIINLTPHAINLILDNNSQVIIESSGIARCEVESILNGLIACESKSNTCIQVPVYVNYYGSVFGLPEVKPECMYIVSRIVAEAMRGKREDLLIVDKTIRDNKGAIIGCRGFSKL